MQEAEKLKRAISRGLDALLTYQSSDGAFEDLIDVGPISVATQLILEGQLGVLSGQDRESGIAALVEAQQADGSYLPFPHAEEGSPVVTALAVAALEAAGASPSHGAHVAATAYLRNHGGFDAAVQAFERRGEVSALYLVAAGKVSGNFLPHLPLSVATAPGLDKLLGGRFHAGNQLAFVVILAVAASVRQPSQHGLLAQFGRSVLHELERGRAVDLLRQWQNPSGGFNEALFPTQLMSLGFHALGCKPSETPLRDSLAWLNRQKRYVSGCLQMQAIPNDIWGTAIAALALKAVGEQAQPALEKAAGHLLREQHHHPQPKANQRKPGAVRTGGWAFQRGNPTMPDADDTGLVLAALGSHAGGRSTRDLFNAIDSGVNWLRDMQNPDGGWGAYVWNLPGKLPGPLYLQDVSLPPLDDPRSALRMFLEPPPELGDPATEGVTARVLWGLGASGLDRNEPMVRRAVEFMRHQQCENGAFWDRWMTCYLPGTATSLLGLRAVGEPVSEPYVQRALQWMKRQSNADGGYGEGYRSFRQPLQAGKGNSMPPVTGFVLSALLACEQYTAPETQAATDYLLEAQQEDGAWPNCGWVNPYVPPDTFYEYPLIATAVPLLALAQRLDCREDASR